MTKTKGAGTKRKAAAIEEDKPSGVALLRRFLLLIEDSSLAEDTFSVTELKADLMANIEYVCELDEHYKDARADLVSAKLQKAGFVWDDPSDMEKARWNLPANLKFESWKRTYDGFGRLLEELKRDALGASPIKVAKPVDKQGPSTAPVDLTKKPLAGGVTPDELGKDLELLRLAKEKLATEREARTEDSPVVPGKDSTVDWGMFNLPVTKSSGCGLIFEESASGVPELKRRKKMTFERWVEWNMNLTDRLPDLNTKRAYRAYVSLVVRFNSTASWNVVAEIDEEVRDMVLGKELSGFDDPRILDRFIVKLRMNTMDGGGDPNDGGRKRPRKRKFSKVCDYYKTPEGCKKGDKCNFKHV